MMKYSASQTVFFNKHDPKEKDIQLFTQVEPRFVNQENRVGNRKGFWVTYLNILDESGNILYSVSVHTDKKTRRWVEEKK